MWITDPDHASINQLNINWNSNSISLLYVLLPYLSFPCSGGGDVNKDGKTQTNKPTSTALLPLLCLFAFSIYITSEYKCGVLALFFLPSG